MGEPEHEVPGSTPDHDVAPAGIAVQEGLSWSWSLDVETLIAALSEPAPWSRPPPAVVVPDAPPEAGAGLPETEPAETATPADTEPADTAPADTAPADTASPAEVDLVEAEFADYLEAVDAGRTSVFPLSAAAGRVAEILPASPDLAAWLAVNPAGDLEDGALAGAAAAYRRLAAWAQAGELAVVAQMASRSAAADKKNSVDEHGRPDKIPADAYGQVSLALTMSQAGAEWWTDLAVNLQWRLAATGTALRTGTIDLPRAKAIAEATAPLDDDKAQAVEAKILPKAGEQTIGQLRASLRRAVITADPEGAERRREEAERRAKVTLYPDAENTASLSGQSLPGVGAAAAMARITALARALKASGTDGGIDLLRSKVFLGLLLGTLPYIPPPPGGPADTDCPPGSDFPPTTDSTPDHDTTPDLAGYPDEHCPADEHYPTDEHYPADESAPDDEGVLDGEEVSAGEHSPVHEQRPANEHRPSPWPQVTPLLPPGPAAMGGLPPVGSGFLDLALPWPTLTRNSALPGYLTRLGPITPAQASSLARLAARDPAVEWRVVLTDISGRAIAVTRTRHVPSPDGLARAGPGSHSSLIRRVTVTIAVTDLATGSHDTASHATTDHGGTGADGNLGDLLTSILTAARKAARQATERADADAAAGGCAHAQASSAYQVPVRLREFVAVRDLTCRFPTCRQPAWRCDLDHTRPFAEDGLTCPCNLGALCRHHHAKLKQHPRWRLDQPEPGTFTWTTPAGRTYTTQPDTQAA